VILYSSVLQILILISNVGSSAVCVCVLNLWSEGALCSAYIWPFSDKNEHSEPLRENGIKAQRTAGLSPV